MTTKAKASKGTLLQHGDGVTPTEGFTTIAEVRSFKGPGEKVGTIDVTSFDSTAKEFISDGLVDAGELTFDINWVGSDAQQQALRTDLRAGTLRNFKLLLNDAITSTKSTFLFGAFVTNFDGPQAGQGESYKASITLKITALPTVTAPS